MYVKWEVGAAVGDKVEGDWLTVVSAAGWSHPSGLGGSLDAGVYGWAAACTAITYIISKLYNIVSYSYQFSISLHKKATSSPFILLVTVCGVIMKCQVGGGRLTA